MDHDEPFSPLLCHVRPIALSTVGVTGNVGIPDCAQLTFLFDRSIPDPVERIEVKNVHSTSHYVQHIQSRGPGSYVMRL